MAKYFYFTRHGQTVWNVENKICGATDIALTDLGHQQAAELGERILKEGIKIDEILYSPLMRAADTAKHISEVTGIPAREELRLKEQNFGKYESLNGIDYILPGSGNANFKITFDNYYQTKNASSTISGTLVNKNYINDSDIIYGKKTDNDFDIVVDKSTLNKLFTGEEKIGIQTGYSVQDLIGYKVNCGDLIFTITGITDIGDYSIFTNKKYMIDILYNSLGTDETMVYDAETSDKYLNYKLIDNLIVKKGRLPENDYEVVININKEIDNPLNSKLENKINNKKLTVVGYYEGNNMLVNENMIKYELI